MVGQHHPLTSVLSHYTLLRVLVSVSVCFSWLLVIPAANDSHFLFLPLHFDEQITWSVNFPALMPLGRFADDVIRGPSRVCQQESE